MKGSYIFDNDFRKFMEMLHADAKDIETELSGAGAAIGLVAEEFMIGRAEVKTVSLDPELKLQCADDCIPQGKAADSFNADEYVNSDVILYDWGDLVSDDCIICHFFSRDVDELVITVYSRPDHSWTEEEKESVRFLMQLMATAFDRARMRELLAEAKNTDSMTHIWNANGYILRGNQLINAGAGSQYTAFYFNLTNFKYVNKAISYQDGDKVIVLYVKKIQQIIKKDEVFGRLGGDNFVALIHNDRTELFLKYISKIDISIVINGEPHDFLFGATSGIYHLSDADRNMGKVMMGISTAYQIAKEVLHQPVVVCTPDIINTFVRGKEVLMKFPNALANREFVVYYQPKVSLSDNMLAGAEALVRWKCGSEIVPPMDFIPMLERNGEICRLDFFVFETLCRDIRRWIDEGRKIPVVSSNFSRWHLKNEDFVDELIRIADRYNVDHKYLEIEVTETTNVNDYSTLLKVVRQIKDNGMAVSIDDFGTGYSSLNMLKEIPVDVLKLDKSLLDRQSRPDELHTNDKIMLKHIISLAEDMSIRVLAEGVETIEQREFLKSAGCNYVQGFLYDRPLIVEEFEKRMAGGKYDI